MITVTSEIGAKVNSQLVRQKKVPVSETQHIYINRYIQEQAQKLKEQSKEMKEQTGQLVGEMATLREELEAKLQKNFQEAIKQLSEVIILIIIYC